MKSDLHICLAGKAWYDERPVASTFGKAWSIIPKASTNLGKLGIMKDPRRVHLGKRGRLYLTRVRIKLSKLGLISKFPETNCYPRECQNSEGWGEDQKANAERNL